MVREDWVTMSAKELRRVHVIWGVVDKQLTQVHAGGLLGLTPRQVRRLVRRMEQEGARGWCIGDGGRRRTGGSPRRRRRRRCGCMRSGMAILDRPWRWSRWRARKAHRGELVQLDGSHHDWLDGRGPQCVLIAYIDDASSGVSLRSSMSMKAQYRRWIVFSGTSVWGLLAIYADKHTTSRSPAKPTVQEQLAGLEPASQLSWAWS